MFWVCSYLSWYFTNVSENLTETALLNLQHLSAEFCVLSDEFV